MKHRMALMLLIALFLISGCSRWFRSQKPVYDNYPMLEMVGSVDGGYSGAGYEYELDEMNTNEFAAIEPNRFQRADLQPLSTFSIDVDTGGYSIVRKFINDYQLPPANAIRTEELLNYFDYDYPEPTGEHPFSIYSEVGTCPWNEKRQLVHIGLKGYEPVAQEVPPSNLVFLIDVSGSMDVPNKLPLVKSALSMLTDQLRDGDWVSIVVYAGAAGLALNPTPGVHKDRIKQALAELEAGGSTAGGEGIQLAYKTAEDFFIEGGNNRVILCTDGDFNVGVSSTAELVKYVEDKRKTGVYLSVLGFGMGNYKDNRMEQIANQGNGNYAYIDDILEAKKVLVNEMSGTLITIAKDVKIQVEFNPAVVGAYRLIGYENRKLQPEDFKDDSKDAGELGAGHTVTALYELIPAGSDEPLPEVDSLRYTRPVVAEPGNTDEMLIVKLRYKLPDAEQSKSLDKPLANQMSGWKECSDSFRWAAAVAAYSLLLQDSPFKGAANWDLVMDLASGSKGADPHGYKAEFLRLAEKASLMREFK